MKDLTKTEVIDWVLNMIFVAKESLSGSNPPYPEWDKNDEEFYKEAINMLNQIEI